MVDILSLRERAKELRKLADKYDDIADAEEKPSTQKTVPDVPKRRSSSVIADARSGDLCFEVLREAGQPMSRDQIMARLKEANRIITDGSLQSYLSRDKRLMSVGRGIWSLRPAPYVINGGGK